MCTLCSNIELRTDITLAYDTKLLRSSSLGCSFCNCFLEKFVNKGGGLARTLKLKVGKDIIGCKSFNVLVTFEPFRKGM